MNMQANDIPLEMLQKFLSQLQREHFFGTVQIICEHGKIYCVKSTRTMKREDIERTIKS